VDAVLKAGVKRVVFASTIAVYAPSGGRVLDEESVAYPDTFYGQTKLAAEAILRLAACSDEERLTMGRRGRQYLLSHFSKNIVISLYESILQKTVRTGRKQK